MGQFSVDLIHFAAEQHFCIRFFHTRSHAADPCSHKNPSIRDHMPPEPLRQEMLHPDQSQFYNLHIKNICKHLPPDPAFASAAY